jgi:glutamyl-tRNA synthetase
VTEVVRGDDLIPSTARQILVYRALGVEPPAYGHAPLVVGPDGKRLAKRHGESRIAQLRKSGMPASKVVAMLAEWSGLPPRDRAEELIRHWDWSRVSKSRVIMRADQPPTPIA